MRTAPKTDDVRLAQVTFIIAEVLKQLEELQQRYADRAVGILTPAQLEQFTKWQQQMSSMQAADMRMASQMFGNKKSAPPP